MFRITDIVNIAIQIEKNGERSYRQAADKVTDPEIREMLLRLAEEERHHQEWFASFDSGSEIDPEHAELEAMGRSLLQDMVAKETFSLDQEELNATDTMADLFRQAKGFEEDTVLFYEFLKGLLDDPLAVTRIDIIIAEERRHAERLEQVAASLSTGTTQ